MTILVYNIAAADGGARLVLQNFHREAMACRQEIRWVFVTSRVALQAGGNVEVLQYPQAKRSLLHRWLFERFRLPKILKKTAPDLVISLQNMPVSGFRGRQFVYLHQSLQYCPKQFSFLKKQERGLAFRQHIICNLYKLALPKAEHIFVQTQWIKDATLRWLSRPADTVTVVPVALAAEELPVVPFRPEGVKTFFYPARAEQYKNHTLLLEACRKLRQRGIEDYRVILTVDPAENAYARELARLAEGLPVDFIGQVTYQQIWQHYGSSILVFPSYLETCGLPLLESRLAGGYILASDLPFAREALQDYPNAAFFCHTDADALADAMAAALKRLDYKDNSRQETALGRSLVDTMLEEAGL